MLLVCRQPNELTSPKFCEAFAQGCGGEVSDTYQGGDWSGFASPDNWDDVQRARQDGFNFYYGDHGYFGRRQFYRITKNDYQHNGDGHSDCSRLAYFGIDIKPLASRRLCYYLSSIRRIYALARDKPFRLD